MVFRKRFIPFIFLLVLGAVYTPSLFGIFVLEDLLRITHNASIQNSVMSMATPFAPSKDIFWQPLTNFTFGLNFLWGQLNPIGYHLFNLVLHFMCGALLFDFARRLLQTDRFDFVSKKQAPILAMVASLLWLIHPLLTSSVTYVSQRDQLLVSFFIVFALYLSHLDWQKPRNGFWRRLAVLMSLFAAACHPAAIAIPILVIMYDRTYLFETSEEAWGARKTYYIGLFGCWVVVGVLALMSHLIRTYPPTFLDYWPEYANTIWHYLSQTFWPDRQILDYQGWPQTPLWLAWIQFISLGAMTVVCVYAVSKREWWAFWSGSILVLLFPFSITYLNHNMMAESHMYLCLFSIIFLLTLCLWKFLHKALGGKPIALAALLLVATPIGFAEGFLTHQRNTLYTSAQALWEDTAAKNPGNPRAFNQLGLVYHEQGEYKKALAAFNKAIELKSYYALAHQNAGSAHYALKDYDNALVSFRQAIHYRPQFVRAYIGLGDTLYKQKETDLAIRAYRKALKYQPDSSTLYSRMGRLYEDLEQIRPALHYYSLALRYHNHAINHNNLGRYLAKIGQLESAAWHLQQAIKMDPELPEAFNNLGDVFAKKDKYRWALFCYMNALSISPNNIYAKEKLADTKKQLAQGLFKKSTETEPPIPTQ